jgi:predicted RNase H-like HicB family nuclease
MTITRHVIVHPDEEDGGYWAEVPESGPGKRILD